MLPKGIESKGWIGSLPRNKPGYIYESTWRMMPLYGWRGRLMILAIRGLYKEVQAAPTQLGYHLHVALEGGGDLYLALSTIADLEADNLIV